MLIYRVLSLIMQQIFTAFNCWVFREVEELWQDHVFKLTELYVFKWNTREYRSIQRYPMWTCAFWSSPDYRNTLSVTSSTFKNWLTRLIKLNTNTSVLCRGSDLSESSWTPTVKWKRLSIFMSHCCWSTTLQSTYSFQLKHRDAVSTVASWPFCGFSLALPSCGFYTARAAMCHPCDRINISSSLIGRDRCRLSHLLNVMARTNSISLHG